MTTIYSRTESGIIGAVPESILRSDPSRNKLVTVARDKHYVLATWGPVGIALWVDDTPAHAVSEAQAMLTALAHGHPEGIGFLQVIHEGCQRLDNQARLGIQTLLKRGRGSIRDAPVVFEGEGFRAGTVRAIVASIASMKDHGFPHRVFSTVHAAADALAQTIESRVPSLFARELTRVIDELRHQHRSAFPPATTIRPRFSLRPKLPSFFRKS